MHDAQMMGLEAPFFRRGGCAVRPVLGPRQKYVKGWVEAFVENPPLQAGTAHPQQLPLELGRSPAHQLV